MQPEIFIHYDVRLPMAEAFAGFDEDAQPVNAKGEVIGKRTIKINDWVVYPPRVLKNLARTARWSLAAHRREERYWTTQIWPLVRAIKEAGGVAFARDREDDRYDMWHVENAPTVNGDLQLTFTMRDSKIERTGEPLVDTAREAHVEMHTKQINRALGMELTRRYTRACRGDMMRFRTITRTVLYWAMREILRRRLGEVRPNSGPYIAEIVIPGQGRWLWKRSESGYSWDILATPDEEIARIEIGDRT